MKTLFSKFVTVFALLLAFCTLLLVLVTISSLTDSNIDRHYQMVRQTAEAVSLLSEASNYRTVADDALKERFYNSVDRICANTPCNVCIADKDGLILFSTLSSEMCGKTIPSDYFTYVYSDEFMRDADDPGELLGTKSLYICRYITGSDAVLLVFDTTVEGSELDERMVSSLIITSLWVLVLATTILYFVTERATYEIREIAQVSEEFANGNFTSRVTIPDNAEVARVATAFNKMADSLEALETMRSSFLANVSHDLRTPMTIIAGYVNNMLDGSIPPEKHEYYLEIILGEIQRLSRLVSTLLDISKLEAGTGALRRSDFCLSETARLVLISCEERIEQKKLDIIFDNDVDVYVNADQDAIHKCLFNLLDNAIKFAPERGFIRISISETNVAGARKARFAICNNGECVPPDELSHIFDRFYKSDRSRNLDKTGTGLGLYIVRTTVVAHGEDIVCTSSQEAGTEFVFTLPAIDSPKRSHGEQNIDIDI